MRPSGPARGWWASSDSYDDLSPFHDKDPECEVAGLLFEENTDIRTLREGDVSLRPSKLSGAIRYPLATHECDDPT